MQHDVIIRGGQLIDGTGAEPVKADIAIDGERITRIGELGDASAGRVIDATGKHVTPGFVDLHTHLDAQVGWDPELTSSSYHGVTTVLIGNCGVGFAPVSEKNRQYMAKLMESVEDIAAEAILDGLPWNWTSYGEYLDSVQALRPALNVVGLAGHSAIRFEAMGDRSMDEGVQADTRELEHIQRLVRESIEQGAVGFSTSRFLPHTVPDGRCTPGTWADLRETRAIQEAAVAAGGVGTLFQSANDFQTRFDTELEMFEQAAELGCQVIFSGGAGPKGDGGVSRWAEFFERQADKGHQITSICHTRPSGSFFGLAQLSPFTKKSDAWRELMALPNLEARVDVLRDDQRRAELIRDGQRIGTLDRMADMLHPFGVSHRPNLDFEQQASLAQLAQAAGTDVVTTYVERLLASEGREFFNLWMFGGALENQWQFMQLPNVVPMLGDAGAHVGLFTDTDSPTVLLSELALKQNVYSLPAAVHKITQQSADLIGLKDRGVLAEGYYADLNVIDFDRLQTCHPYYVNDFPHGGGRFVVESEGYDVTMVAGQVVVENCRHTGTRPGRVLRDFVRG